MDLSDFPSTSVKALCALLNNSANKKDTIENQCPLSSRINGPGDIGIVRKLEQKAIICQPKICNKDIWNLSEVQEGSEFDDSLDPREQPEFEILFKQRVGSEDILMAVSRKDLSTACCQDVVVRISLPGTNVSDVCLDVRKKYLYLRTPKYKLGIHLPHPVNEELGNAKFIVDTEILELTLSSVRKFGN